MIRKYLTKEEIPSLLTSNFYSVLFCNLEKRHVPNLKPPLKKLLLFASANALKLAQRTKNFYESFIDIPKSCKFYKHAILLHKLYNIKLPQADCIDLNTQQIYTSHQSNLKMNKKQLFSYKQPPFSKINNPK